jgi:hypothetical protein
LGFAVASGISSKQDKVLGLKGAYTIGQKTRGNTTHYRNNGDIVSLLGSGTKHNINLKNPNIQTGILPIDILNSHNLDNIKNQKIFV